MRAQQRLAAGYVSGDIVDVACRRLEACGRTGVKFVNGREDVKMVSPEELNERAGQAGDGAASGGERPDSDPATT